MRAIRPIEAAADQRCDLAAEVVPMAAVVPVVAVALAVAVTQVAMLVAVTAAVDMAAADTDNG